MWFYHSYEVHREGGLQDCFLWIFTLFMPITQFVFRLKTFTDNPGINDAFLNTAICLEESPSSCLMTNLFKFLLKIVYG